ncbi:MAG: hypothetical protein IH935_05840 [Acidobacteria bacterium]|nr:hypothetical protein [Acidobacteriota bacterium]
MLLVWIALAVLAVATGGFILLLYSPVVVTVDTGTGQMGIRWLALLTYLRPLPWAKGSRQLLLAGIPIPLAALRGSKKRRRARGQPRARRRKHFPFLFRLLRGCFRDSTIRRVLALQLVSLAGGVLRSVELARWRGSLSLPDPALNGMLAGVLAQGDWGPGAGIFVNFTGENALQMEFRLHPDRLAKALLGFLFRLPYKAIYKQCLAS